MTDRQPLAQVWLPMVTGRYAAILNAEARLNRQQAGAVKYRRDENPPTDRHSPTSWLVYTPEALAQYRRLGALVQTLA